MDSNELYHYGVLGMRWGHRKDRRSSSGIRLKKQPSTKGWSKDAKAANSIKRKSVKQMSNAELKRLNERTRLEQEYSRLNPNAVKKGLAVAAGIAGGMGTVLALHNNGKQLISIGKKFVKKVA